MKGWGERALNELGIVARGKSRHRPRNAPELYNGPYPLIQTGDIEAADYYINEYTQTYSEIGLAQSKLWPKNTLCISIVGANTGASAILKFDACFPDSVIGFLPFEDKADVYFVKYSLEILRQKLKHISEGAARENLSLEKLLTVKLSVPDLYVQRRIASILSAYDDLIENNLKRIKLLEEIAQRTYEEWFVKFRVNGKQLPIDKKTGLPEGWEKVSMTEIADFINGFAFKPTDWMKNGRPIIKIKEMKAGVSNDTPRNDGSRVPSKYLVRSGDILFSWSGSLEVIIWQGEDGWLNQHLFLVKPTNDIPRAFVFQSLLITLNEFNNLTTGATMKHIKRKELDFVKIALPDVKTLAQYQKVAEPLQDQILVLARQNRLLKESRDILLPRLMSGEIEV